MVGCFIYTVKSKTFACFMLYATSRLCTSMPCSYMQNAKQFLKKINVFYASVLGLSYRVYQFVAHLIKF